jgi:hypothetical protein
MSIDDIEQTGADDDLFAGLHRSVAGATMTTSAADVVALGRRTRTRHRAVAAGVGTSMAALVAAIGVLAPTGGSGTTVVQDVGFTIQKGADGSVDVAVHDAFDPVVIKAALDKAGVKNDVQVVHLPADWDWKGGTIPDCAATPGAKRDPRVNEEAAKKHSSAPRLKISTGDGSYFVFPVFPAGDVVAVVRFYPHDPVVGSNSMPYLNGITALTGMPGKCVPVPAGSVQAAGITT